MMTTDEQNPEPDDRKLIARAAQGDMKAMDELVRRHQNALSSFVAHDTGNISLALEIAQETFVRAWLNAGKYRDDAGASVRTWLFSIAINLIRDDARRRSRFGRIVGWLTGGDSDLVRECAGDPGVVAPDIHAEHTERLASLEAAIARLPEKLRLPLVLCSIEEMSQEDAARILGITRKAVELRIRRARENLRRELS
jgi:RNA polymerase sigma-70 factor (ECF subfamily)